MDKYKNFSLEDLLQDEFFRKSMREPLSKEAELWESWLSEHDEMRPVVEEARIVLLSLEPGTIALPADFYVTLKQRIDQTIAAGAQPRAIMPFFPKWLYVAAVFAGLIVAAALLFYSVSPKIAVPRYSSQYGETKKIVLPDGSGVLLNAKSSIEYRQDAKNNRREVWLNGEGFFDIRHQEDGNNNAVPFVVHTGGVDVEVLGTQFNVNSNDSASTSVLLTKGKVRLSVMKGGLAPVTMRPDQLLLYDRKSNGLSVNAVASEKYLSWMKHQYIFEKTNLLEISKVIGRYYGKEVVISDKKLAGEKMSGTLELQDEATLMRTLSALLGVHVDNNNNRINIHSE